MGLYTFDQFKSEAEKEGLYGNFSQADLALAQKNPDAGMSLLQYKKDWRNATTDEARLLANAGAEKVRKTYGNYTGGTAGSKYYAGDPTPGSFYAGEAPSYTNAYKDKENAALDDVTDYKDFSYDYKTDDLYGQYKKAAMREGQRSSANTLGQLAGATGGIPSSYAATAASQAGDYYAAKLADKVPELYQIAYNKYLNDYQRKRQNLADIQSVEQGDYNKFLNDRSQFNTDRSLGYQQWTDDLGYQANLRAEEKQDARQAKQDAQEAEDRKLQNALTAAQFGDYRPIEGLLGIDTSNYTVEQQNALQKAEAAASYGYYDPLEKILGLPKGTLTKLQQTQTVKSYAAPARSVTNGSHKVSTQNAVRGAGQNAEFEQAAYSTGDRTLDNAITSFTNGDFGDNVIQILLGYGVSMEELVESGYGAAYNQKKRAYRETAKRYAQKKDYVMVKGYLEGLMARRLLTQQDYQDLMQKYYTPSAGGAELIDRWYSPGAITTPPTVQPWPGTGN